MTLTDIRTQPIDRVRAFVNEFAKKADVRNQAAVDLLHEARRRLQVEYGRQWLAQRQPTRK